MKLGVKTIWLFFALALPVRTADLPPIVVGAEGDTWKSGGGTIPALVKTSETTVEETNTPGDVLNLDVEGFPNWVFPQKIDSTRSVLIGGEAVTPQVSFGNLEGDFRFMIDGSHTTAFEVRSERAGELAGGRGLIIDFDLGAVFSVNRIKFFPRNADPDSPTPLFPFQKDFIKGYELSTNDGSPETNRNGTLEWSSLVRVGQNESAVADYQFTSKFIRYIRFQSLSNLDFEIAEFQVFSLGFVPQATYVSNVYDLEGSALLGNLRWLQNEQGDPRRSRVRVRTRTGRDSQPLEFSREGVQPTGRTRSVAVVEGVVEEDILIDAVWKKADALADAGNLVEPVLFGGRTIRSRQALVEDVLDNEDATAGEVQLIFDRLVAEDRDLIAMDQSAYFDLNEDERTGIGDDLTSWSPWSPPYTADGIVGEMDLDNPLAGTPLTSPDGRRFFQFMLEFSSDSFAAATGVGGLAFDVATPSFADSLVGEIFPRAAALGVATEFTYAVLIQLGGGEGFDQLEITTPVRTSSVGQVQIVHPDGGRLEADFSASDFEQLPLVDEATSISVQEIADTRLVLAFSDETLEDGTLLKVAFTNAVLRFGTRFDGRVLSGTNSIGQQLLAGNVADLSSDGLEDPDPVSVGTLKQDNLSVSVPISKDLLVNVGAQPAVFTPNEDGANDETAITYDVTNIGKLTPVKVRIYDLSGRLVRSFDDPRTSGRHRRVWDGRDEAQQLVAPGHYLYRVSIDAKNDEFAQVGVIGVTY